jgi:hypothetical protein
MYVKKEKKKENVYLGYVGANTKMAGTWPETYLYASVRSK